MMTVKWPSQTATRAECWRVLDLSGMTNNVRQSRDAVLAGCLYVDGNHILSLKDTVEIGKKCVFELRYNNGTVRRRVIFLVRPILYKPRRVGPTVIHRKP